MNLTYQAIDTRGRHVDDTLEAATVKDGVEELRRQGLFVTHVAAAKENAAPDKSQPVAGSGPAGAKLPLSQLVLFTRQMSMLLTSGSAIVPALSAIALQMKSPEHRRMLDQVTEDLEQGVSLTDTLRKYPKSFDASYCAVVAAGESSATLPEMFSRLATIISKRRAIRNRVIGSLIYPALLLFLSAGILSVMMFFVVPRFAGMFSTLGVELPLTTKMIMGAAESLRDSWILVLLLAAGAVTGVVVLFKTAGGRQLLTNVQIRVPVVGRLLSRLIQAQTFRVLGMLLEARVGLLEALELARKVTSNDRFQSLFDALGDSITRGESVSGPLEQCGLINPSIVQAVRTGEQSGKLGDSISYVADVLDEENTELLAAVTKLIEPLVLIVMGVIVGAVAISLFMPLFDMTAAM